MAQWLNVDFFRNVLSALEPALMVPDTYVHSINQVPWRELKDQGVRGVIFDADQTIVSYHGTEVHPAVQKTFGEIKEIFGPDKLVILSNYAGNQKDDRRIQRYRSLEANLGIAVVHGIKKKPSPEGYEAALAKIGVSPWGAVMVGDRLGTDILGARIMALRYTILVDPFEPERDPPYTRIPRKLEQWWYRANLKSVRDLPL